jgi:dolichol-phosphate mannosyltransferase
MNKNVKLSVIIPAYQEEENLRIILPRLQKELSSFGESYELLLVDTIQDMDNTKAVCLENNAVHINREFGNDYGDAIRTGIKKAKGEFIVFMDADGSHAPEFIKNIYRFKDNYDVVIASRYIEGGSTDNSKILVFMSLIVNMLYSLVLGIKCKDVSNSFKLYKSNQLKKLHLKCSNFDIVEEILYKLIKRNKSLKIKEVPFTFKQRMFGHTKRNLVAFIFSYVFTIIRLRFDI